MQVTIAGGLFAGNYAASGGAVDVGGQALVLINSSRFSKNTADDSGGAVSAYGQSTCLVNSCNFSSNQAFDGAAVLGTGDAQVYILVIDCLESTSDA